MSTTSTVLAPTGSKDPEYESPYVDVDEWRETPVRYRYVHGGFEGTDLRFSYYFPPAEQYEGRFFHPIMAMSGNEHAFGMGALFDGFGRNLEFALNSGGYMVESN